jgi:hypothetical protein
MVSSLIVFMDLHSFLIYRHVGGSRLCPTAGIVVFDSIALVTAWLVGMSAEHPLRPFRRRVRQRPGSHFAGQAKPCRVQPLEKTREAFLPKIQLLDLEIEGREQIAERKIIDNKAVELMAVNR